MRVSTVPYDPKNEPPDIVVRLSCGEAVELRDAISQMWPWSRKFHSGPLIRLQFMLSDTLGSLP